jgi:hypothetical protein
VISTGEYAPSARSSSYGEAGISGGWAMKRGLSPWCGCAVGHAARILVVGIR